MAVILNAETHHLTRSTGLPNHELPYTVMGWVKPLGLSPSYRPAFGLWSDTGNIDYVFGANAYFTSYTDGPGGAWDTGNFYKPRVNQWFHFTLFRLDASYMVFAINGKWSTYRISNNQTGRASPTTLSIGDSPWGGEYGNHLQIYTRFWERVLSLNEVREEMYSTSPVHTAQLYGDWRMDRPSDLGRDYSGRQNNLTVNGSPSFSPEIPPPLKVVSPKIYPGAWEEVIFSWHKVYKAQSYNIPIHQLGI